MPGARAAPPAAEPEPQPVAGRVRRAAQQQLVGLGRDVLAQQLARGREAARGEHHRHAVRAAPAQRRARSSISPASARDDRVRVEAAAHGAGVPGRGRRHPRAARLEPVEVAVEALEQRALERLVAVRALAPERPSQSAWRQSTPEEKRIAPPGARGLLEVQHARAQLARVRRGGQAGHARAGHDQVGAHRQREARLVLDVLQLDPPRRPDEHRERVGGVDDVGDLGAASRAPRARPPPPSRRAPRGG